MEPGEDGSAIKSPCGSFIEPGFSFQNGGLQSPLTPVPVDATTFSELHRVKYTHRANTSMYAK